MMNIGGMGMYNNMSSMGGMNSMSSGGNVLQSFENKYGCEACFRKGPYYQEYNKPVPHLVMKSVNLSFWQQIKNKLLG